MEEKFNPSRRFFLKTLTGVVGAGLVGDEILSLDTRNVDSDFPKPKQVPEFLADYTMNFHSWPEMIEDQKDRLIKFIDSKVCRRALQEHLTEYFPNKSKEEIQILVNELVQDKIKYVDSLKIKYQDLLKKGLLGHYSPNKHRIELDTIAFEPHIREFKKHKNYTRERADIFVAVHEFYHGSQVLNLTLARTYQHILETLASSSQINTEDTERAMENLKVLDNGRIKKLPEKEIMFFANHALRPTEIIPSLMEIRIAMHIVSENNKALNIPKYDMYNDEFKMEYLVFMNENKEKIFSDISFPDKGPYKMNTFKILTTNLVAEDLLYLINKCI